MIEDIDLDLFLLLLRIAVVIGRAAVLRGVQAQHLLVGRGAQQAQLGKDEEEQPLRGHHPQEDADDANDLGTQELALAAVEDTVVGGIAVHLAHVGLVGEETHHDEPPRLSLIHI